MIPLHFSTNQLRRLASCLCLALIPQVMRKTSLLEISSYKAVRNSLPTLITSDAADGVQAFKSENTHEAQRGGQIIVEKMVIPSCSLLWVTFLKILM